MKMLKHIKIIVSLLLSVLVGGCADEFEWHGTTVGADEYLIAYTTSAPQMDMVAGTRASDADRDAIGELTLVVFDERDNLYKEPIHFTPGTDVCTNPVVTVNNGKKEVTPGSLIVKRGDVTTGSWYLIANAKTVINTYVNGKSSVSKNDFLTEITFDDSQIIGVDASNQTVKHVMVANHDMTVGDETQAIANIFDLERLYTRVSVEIAEGKTLPFVMTGARLTRYVAQGDLNRTVSNSVPSTAVSDNEGYIVPPTGTVWNKDGISFKYANGGEQLIAGSYPFKEADNAVNNQKIMMLVKGYYNTSGDVKNPSYDSDNFCYYAVPLPDLEANHHLRVIINAADAPGQSSAQDAEDNPGGLSVEFKDQSSPIHTILSDGENVLAVPDTVRIKSNEVAYAFDVMARTKSNVAPSISIDRIGTESPSWFKGINIGTASDRLDEEESQAYEKGLFTTRIPVSGSVDANTGSEREVKYKVSLDGTSLYCEVVILQEANATIKYSDAVKISLRIIRNGVEEALISDYLGFINKAIVNDTPSDTVYGIHPAYNGGRVRNLGIHWPMPNSEPDKGVKYEYTIAPQNDFTLKVKNSSGTSYSDYGKGGITLPAFLDSEPMNNTINEYGYAIETDKYVLEKDGVEYSLDLYHTGFFHHASDGWYYYEVITEDEDNNLFWLDRNLGAKSAGMGVLRDNYLSGAWPLVGDKAVGGRYNMAEAEAAAPKGWGVPSFAQLRSLTVASGFSTKRMVSGDMRNYFAPAFSFYAQTDGSTSQITSYFPANRKYYNGELDGYEGAGYYLTTTPAGSEGWYKTMQFSGMNITAENTDMSKTKMSVRLCAGEYDPQTQSTKFICSVKGYTHVFMYHLNSDGTKTYLTTWPGDQIAVFADKDRYHPFEITPTMDYDLKNIRVIFNIVKDGVWQEANVSNDNATSRTGILFRNNKKYDIAQSPAAEGAQKGNWVTEGTINYSDYKYRLKGNYNQSNANTWQSFSNAFTDEGDGIHRLKGLVITLQGNPADSNDKKDEFVLQRSVATSNSWGDWGKADYLNKRIPLGEWMTVDLEKGYDYNWKFQESGTYDIEFNENTMKIKVTKSGSTPDPDPVITVRKDRYALKGFYNNRGWENGSDNTDAFTYNSTSGKWELTLNVSSLVTQDKDWPDDGQFMIQHREENGSYSDWGWSDDGTNAKAVVNDSPMTIRTVSGTGKNWKFTSTGTYLMVIDDSGDTKTLTVTKQ